MRVDEGACVAPEKLYVVRNHHVRMVISKNIGAAILEKRPGKYGKGRLT
jgi:hypothetical protein